MFCFGECKKGLNRCLFIFAVYSIGLLCLILCRILGFKSGSCIGSSRISLNMLAIRFIGCICNWIRILKGIDALFELCSLKIVGKFVIFTRSLGCSFLVQVFLKIDAQNISNLFLLKFENLPLSYRKDPKSKHQVNKAVKFYPTHHYNEPNSWHLHINFWPNQVLHRVSRKYIHTI